MGYYKQVEGVQYDRALVEAAEEAVAGRGDGRISRADAEKLLPLVTDGGKITAVEKATLVYLRKNFKWTDKADAWFRAALKAWDLEEDDVSTETSDTAPVAVIVRFDSYPDTAKHFPADALKKACEGAGIFIRADTEAAIPFSEIWKHTKPHKTKLLPHDVQFSLCDSARNVVQDHFWAFAKALGTRGGKVHWLSGYDNISADHLEAALKELGFSTVDITDII